MLLHEHPLLHCIINKPDYVLPNDRSAVLDVFIRDTVNAALLFDYS